MGQIVAAAIATQPITLAERPDFHVIGEIIEPNSRVLDLGCGEGELLAWLTEHKHVLARGVEISPAQVRRAIARGVSVYQGDINEGLADYPDKAFDYVILSQTLQETRAPLQLLQELLRVGQPGHHLVSEFRPLGRADSDAGERPGAEDASVSAQLVQLTEYPLPQHQ